MEKIFLDTSFLIAYHNRKDENHEEASKWVSNIRKERIRFVISDYIFDEVLTVCTSYVLMKALNILKGVSFDEHFKQFGFEVVI